MQDATTMIWKDRKMMLCIGTGYLRSPLTYLAGIAAAAFTLLATIFAAAVGILAAWSAPTVKQEQALVVAMIVLFAGPTVISTVLPAEFAGVIARWYARLDFGPLSAYCVVSLCILSAAMVGLALGRFKYTRLLLC